MAEPGPGKDAELLRATGPPASGPGLLHACLYALSVAVFAVTAAADFSVVIELWLNSHESWAYFRMALVVIPSCLLQFLSLKWYQTNDVVTKHHCIPHFFQLAIVHRFVLLFNFAVRSVKNQASDQENDWIRRIANDTLTLNLFTSMLLFVPQIVFLSYILAMQQYISFFSCASIAASVCSLTWSMIFYAVFTSRSKMDQVLLSWSSVMIKGFWRGGMLASRIAALVLMSICFRVWILAFFGIHALGMTSWMIHQTTNFCIPAVEELVYKCLIGAVHFFDYFKLTDVEAKHQVYIFYLVTTAQNIIIYVAYVTSFKNFFHVNILVVSSVLIVGGSTIGIVSMCVHFCIFQSFKGMKPNERIADDAETHFKPSVNRRTGKSSTQNETNTVELGGCAASDFTADKKSLLTNIEQNIEFVEKGIINTSFINSDEIKAPIQIVVEDDRVISLNSEKQQNFWTSERTSEDTCSNVSPVPFDEVRRMSSDTLQRQKRRGICSEIELGLKPIEGNLDLDPQLCSQKRRGICSLAQLGLELVTDEHNYVEKSFSTLGKLRSDSESSVHRIAEKSLSSGILDAVSIRDLVFSCRRDQPIPESILFRGRLSTPTMGSDGDGDSPVSSRQVSYPGRRAVLVDPDATFPATRPVGVDNRQQLLMEEETVASYAASIHDYENVCPLGVARPPWCIRSWRGYTDIETYIHDDSVVRDRRRDTLTSTATGTTLSSADLSDAATWRLGPSGRRSRQDDYLDTLVYDLVERAESPSASASAGLDPIAEEREEQQQHQPLSSLVATIDEIRRCAPDGSPAPPGTLDGGAHQQAAGTTLRQLRQRRRLLLEPGTPLINAILSDSPILGPKAAIAAASAVTHPDEDNVYVDMNALGVQRCSSRDNEPCTAAGSHAEKEKTVTEDRSDFDESMDNGAFQENTNVPNRKRVVFSTTNEIIKDSSDSCSEKSDSTTISIDPTNTASFHARGQEIAANRLRRKFSLLRERFEPKTNDFAHRNQLASSGIFANRSVLANVMTLPYSFVMLNNDSNSLSSSPSHDHENLVPKPSLMIEGNRLHSDSLKEKRNLFFKQFLSPPKFPGWGKKRTFSPNAKITPKTH